MTMAQLHGLPPMRVLPHPPIFEDGIIEGYASLFGVSDMAKDIIEPGAFSQSLLKRGASGVRMLWQHDAAQPIGIWQRVYEDQRGLYVRGRLNLALERARDIYALISDGAVDGLSIGFKAERARSEGRNGARRLFAVDLWEISIVTFPMLPGARVRAATRDHAERSNDQSALAGAIRRATNSLLKARNHA